MIRWSPLCSFLNDGRIELDTNTVAGIRRRRRPTGNLCSLITNAKLNEVEPFAYVKDVLERMSSGHPMSRLDDLLPWNWQPKTEKS